MYLKPGTILNNRYEVEAVLGHGGFGITYRARDLVHQLPVAIKEYLPSGAATRVEGQTWVTVFTGAAREEFLDGKKKFLEEAQALARFAEHPHIVRALGYFEANGTAYMVMEYVEGQTFKQFLEHRGGRIPFDEAKNLLLPVMAALEAVHRQGLLHRDISPDNIYLTHRGEVKLLDFGAARWSTGEQSRSLSVILKTGYAPEEQYRSSGRQGPWTDVYALAATFYRAVTGQIPPEALDRKEKDTLVPPSRVGVAISPGEEQALLTALAVDQRQRFQTMGAFREALRTAGNVTPPQATPAPPGPRPSPGPSFTWPAARRPFPVPTPAPAGAPRLRQSSSQLAALVIVPVTVFVLVLGLIFAWQTSRQPGIVGSPSTPKEKTNTSSTPKLVVPPTEVLSAPPPQALAPPQKSIMPLPPPEADGRKDQKTEKAPTISALPLPVPIIQEKDQGKNLPASPSPPPTYELTWLEEGSSLKILLTRRGEGAQSPLRLVATSPSGEKFQAFFNIGPDNQGYLSFPQDFNAPDWRKGKYVFRLFVNELEIITKEYHKKADIKTTTEMPEIKKPKDFFESYLKQADFTKKFITEKDLENLTIEEVRTLRLEIFNNTLKRYKNGKYYNYFKDEKWDRNYGDVTKFQAIKKLILDNMSEIERKNYNSILLYEIKKGSAQRS